MERVAREFMRQKLQFMRGIADNAAPLSHILDLQFQ